MLSFAAAPSSFLQLLCVIALLLILASCAPPSYKPSPYKSWAVYYNDQAPTTAFEAFDLVVFDADKHPDIWKVKAHGTKVLAYFSLAEIAGYRSFAKRFAQLPGSIIGDNKEWGSKVVDIRKNEWREFFINEWLPAAMSKGFDGVFIDTTDTALLWQEQDSVYEGMDDAAVEIISELRANLPQEKLIMVNRGFEILPRIAKHIDIILAESIMIDGSDAKKREFDAHIYDHYAEKLQQLRQKHSHLSIFTLDYPQTIDKTAWLHICRKQQKQGFVPYISTPDLQQVTALSQCN